MDKITNPIRISYWNKILILVGEIGVKVNVDDLEFDEEEDKDTINTVKRKRRTVLDFQDLDEEQERIKKKLDIKLLKVISKEVDNLDRIVR